MPTALKITSEKYYDELQAYVRDSFNKDTMLRFCSEIKKAFPDPCTVEIRGAVLTLEEFISPKKIREYRSDELVKLLALFIMDDDRLRNYFNSLPPQFLALINLLLRQKYVSSKYLKAIGLESCISVEESRWYYEPKVEIRAHDIWFSSTKSYDYKGKSDYERDVFFCIDSRFYWIAAKVLFPEEVLFPYFAGIPESGKYDILDAEAEAFATFPAITGLIRQGSLKFSAFKVTQASSFKVMKQLPLKDVFPDMTEYSMKYNLGQLLFPYINHALSHKADGYQNVARKAYNCLKDYYIEENLPNLLPFVKGFRATVLRNYGRSSILSLASQALIESGGKWINIESLSYQTIGQYGTLSVRAFDNLHLENATLGDSITPGEITSSIELPLLQSFFAVLYGLGGASLACETPDADSCLTPLEHIKYVRLNNFGKYIIGLTETYESQEIKQEKLFELDPDHLIIRSLKPGNPYESLLFDTAVPIGGGRFKMSPETFLAKCKSKKDVQEKTQFFKDYICNDLPQVWESFFSNIKKRCKPFTSEDTRFYLYTLDPADKELARLLTTDEVLKKIVIKAEGFRILVPDAKETTFEQRLKQYGYLV